jgi:DNA polymerase III delta subunit
VSNQRVCWLSGNIQERKALLNKIIAFFKGGDIQRLSGDFSLAYLEQQVFTDNCFAEKRLIILNELPVPSGTRQTMINNLKKLLDKVPDGCVVVFDGVEDGKPIGDHIAKIGKVYDFAITLDRNEASGWIGKQFSEKNKSISPECTAALIQSCGYDISVKGLGIDQLRLAIAKISTYMGRRKTVEMSDIIINALNVEEFIQWKMFDALDAKSFEQCQEFFEKFVENEANGQRAVDKLYSISLPRYRLLFFLKEGLAQKIPKDQLAQQAMAIQKNAKSEKDNSDIRVPAYTQFAVDSALMGAYGRPPTVDLYTRKELVRAIDCLTEGMTEVRTRGNSSLVLLLADAFFLSVCSQIDDVILSNLRKSED